MARRTKEDAEATRNKLLDAAAEVFFAKGVAGASLSEVAQAAGLTRGAIYWHFKDNFAVRAGVGGWPSQVHAARCGAARDPGCSAHGV